MLFQRYNKMKLSEEQLLEGIKKKDNMTISYIYKEYFGGIRGMIFRFQNLSLNPEEIFQEGLTTSIMNIEEGRFQGKSSFKTYLTSICRNIALKQLNRKDPVLDTTGQDYEQVPEVDDLTHDLVEMVRDLKNQLDEKCKHIINARFDETTGEIPGFEEIAEKLGLTPANARQRFKRCLDKLREIVFKNPGYEELINR